MRWHFLGHVARESGRQQVVGSLRLAVLYHSSPNPRQHARNHPAASGGALVFNPFSFVEGDDQTIARRIKEIVAQARAG